jgi:hypothetical protein
MWLTVATWLENLGHAFTSATLHAGFGDLDSLQATGSKRLDQQIWGVRATICGIDDILGTVLEHFRAPTR